MKCKTIQGEKTMANAKAWIGTVAATVLVISGGIGGVHAVDASTHKDKTLVIYSNSFSNGRGEWIQKQAAKAGFKIKEVQLGSGDLVNRVVSEKNKPIADVIYGSNQYGFDSLASKGLLQKFSVNWKKDVPSDQIVGKGYYYPTDQEKIILISKPGLAKADTPTSWDDLTKAKFAGQYTVPGKGNLGSGTNLIVIAQILSQYRDDKADTGVSDAGWKAIGNYFKNGVQLKPNTLFAQPVNDDNAKVGYTFSSDLANIPNTFKWDANVIPTKGGVPVATEQLGVVKKSGDTKTAQAFANWFGSAKVQKAWAKKFHINTLNEKAQSAVPDYQKQLAKEVKVHNIDVKWYNKHIDQWVEKINLEYLQ